MGSVLGDSGGDGTSEASGAGDRDAGDEDLDELVVELIDDEPLPEEGPNSAASDRETIGRDREIRPRGGRLPRAVRVAGVVAVALTFALTVWPAAGRREPPPQPVPTPSQLNADLFKVRLSDTSLRTQDGADHAVLGLALTNGATTGLEVVSAELWDAVGTRLGSASVWPAEGLAPGSTVTVPVTLPYACDVYGFLPVLPITIRYSISTPQNPDAGHAYAYPLTSTLWNLYLRQRAGRCSTPESVISASSIDTTQPIGAPADPQGFDLAFTVESSGTTAWNVVNVASSRPDVTITGGGWPVLVSSGQEARVSTHWHVGDCSHVPRWSQDLRVEFTARPANPTVGSGGATQQTFVAELRPGLVTQMVAQACGA